LNRALPVLFFRLPDAGRSVGVRIGGANGIDLPVPYPGAQGRFAGLDQVNMALPRSLAGIGAVEVNLTVDGRAANTVQIRFRNGSSGPVMNTPSEGVRTLPAVARVLPAATT